MRRHGVAKTIGLVGVAVIVAAVVLYAALRPPIGWPTEDRRVSHPAGFSVIAPDGWERHISSSTNARSFDSLKFLPAKAVGSPGYFSVTKLAQTPTDSDSSKRGYSATTFAGSPAWVKETEQKDTREHTRNIVFQSEGNWFEIALRRPAAESLDSGSWKAYISSFRTESPKTASIVPTLPATLPATLP